MAFNKTGHLIINQYVDMPRQKRLTVIIDSDKGEIYKEESYIGIKSNSHVSRFVDELLWDKQSCNCCQIRKDRTKKSTTVTQNQIDLKNKKKNVASELTQQFVSDCKLHKVWLTHAQLLSLRRLVAEIVDSNRHPVLPQKLEHSESLSEEKSFHKNIDNCCSPHCLRLLEGVRQRLGKPQSLRS
ncbi:hypothetical protein [Psychroflexus sp. ALD_RP9]|uniref:hypothetical protein n=1 Tax=Psychroflexus sp. ALD_RP9 TaxID=2777186 RepID=UPI001A8C81A3|nr:hypothetical protein [Psychroflexus sp. ALD_RP9]QSS96620.1 hypothetical protein IMZ30_09220 [Psychroflexus sp. ALD_RP9]